MTKTSPPDVMGLETELGLQSNNRVSFITDDGCIRESLSKEAFSDKTDMQRNQGKDFWLTNGGRIYLDQTRWEICTPETRTLRDFLIWQRAMERIITRSVEINPNLKLYKNNLDTPFQDRNTPAQDPFFYQSTWGAHMNYTTALPLAKRLPLVLPAVLEKLLSGSGNLTLIGEFDISQRAKKINNVHPDIIEHPNPECSVDVTSENKLFLLDGKNDYFERDKSEYLFHHTSNDSNMLDNAEWLKVGFMRNMIALAENGCLPDINYNPREAIKDLRHLTNVRNIQEDPLLTQSRWYLPSILAEDRSALDLLKKYNDRSKSELSGKDTETDFTIELTDHVISSLQRFGQEPDILYGVLDWVTKRYLLKEKMKYEGLPPNNDEVQSVNLEYHCLNSGSLFQDLRSMGGIEIVPTEAEIRNAVMNPPTNTRAYARGEMVRHKLSGFGKRIEGIHWNKIIFHTGMTIPMPDARNNYQEQLSQLLSRTN
ncbi:MAG: proteasome accessory factor PafA2 family protein [Nanoarchaeota archaeon]|nr:proteasome accessory factor PafA2 family protein [Nanoarchaeota archaeon]